jgi:hypothetical protein
MTFERDDDQLLAAHETSPNLASSELINHVNTSRRAPFFDILLEVKPTFGPI